MELRVPAGRDFAHAKDGLVARLDDNLVLPIPPSYEHIAADPVARYRAKLGLGPCPQPVIELLPGHRIKGVHAHPEEVSLGRETEIELEIALRARGDRDLR